MHHESGLSVEAAAPFVRHFRGQTFVVKMSGALLDNSRALESIAAQLALLEAFGIRLVVVHGGGTQAKRLAERLGVPQKQVAGRRITDDATLEVVTMAFAGQARTALLASLRRHGISAVGLSGIDARLTVAVQRPPMTVDAPDGSSVLVDFGHVADLESVHPHVVTELLDAGHIPVISPLAGDDNGRVFNINADTLAARLAVELGAAKVIFLTEVPGLLRDINDATTLISHITVPEIDQLVRDGIISGGMLPKLAACRTAIDNGVTHTHLVAGLAPHALVREIFTNEGSGTLITAAM